MESLPVVRPDDITLLRGSRRPLSASLERQLLAQCDRAAPHRIEAIPMLHGAPVSLAELIEQTHGDCRSNDEHGAGSIMQSDGARGSADREFTIGERIPVSARWSGRTIWSSARVNYLARAWHDSIHLLHCAEFDIDGELLTARVQCSRIIGKPERAILWIETIGQVQYHVAHGRFPDNQRQFVLDALRHGLDLTIDRGVYHHA